MKRVRLFTSLAGPGRNHVPGDVIPMHDEEADRFVAANLAEHVDDSDAAGANVQAEAKPAVQVETAVAPQIGKETAVSRAPKASKAPKAEKPTKAAKAAKSEDPEKSK